MVKAKIIVNEDAKVSGKCSRLQYSSWIDGKCGIVEFGYLLREANDKKFSFGWVE